LKTVSSSLFLDIWILYYVYYSPLKWYWTETELCFGEKHSTPLNGDARRHTPDAEWEKPTNSNSSKGFSKHWVVQWLGQTGTQTSKPSLPPRREGLHRPAEKLVRIGGRVPKFQIVLWIGQTEQSSLPQPERVCIDVD